MFKCVFSFDDVNTIFFVQFCCKNWLQNGIVECWIRIVDVVDAIVDCGVLETRHFTSTSSGNRFLNFLFFQN